MGTVVIVVLLLIAVGMLALSFFVKDDNPEMDRKIENFSISLMKEVYQLNRKVETIEGQVFADEKEQSFAGAVSSESAKKDIIIAMHNEGRSASEIAQIMEITEDEVKTVLAYDKHKSGVEAS